MVGSALLLWIRLYERLSAIVRHRKLDRRLILDLPVLEGFGARIIPAGLRVLKKRFDDCRPEIGIVDFVGDGNLIDKWLQDDNTPLYGNITYLVIVYLSLLRTPSLLVRGEPRDFDVDGHEYAPSQRSTNCDQSTGYSIFCNEPSSSLMGNFDP